MLENLIPKVHISTKTAPNQQIYYYLPYFSAWIREIPIVRTFFASVCDLVTEMIVNW